MHNWKVEHAPLKSVWIFGFQTFCLLVHHPNRCSENSHSLIWGIKCWCFLNLHKNTGDLLKHKISNTISHCHCFLHGHESSPFNGAHQDLWQSSKKKEPESSSHFNQLGCEAIYEIYVCSKAIRSRKLLAAQEDEQPTKEARLVCGFFIGMQPNTNSRLFFLNHCN